MSLTTARDLTITREDDDVDYEDETPFLKNDDDGVATLRKRSPLPIKQISFILLPWIAQSIVDHSIGPYLNQLVRELPIVGGDVRKVGYYTGIIVSMHHAAEALTSIYWNRRSDHVGRKPVLLIGLAGTIVSIVWFGLSRSFWTILLSRCLHGAFKSSLGAVKSMTAEVTDESNLARTFSLLPMTWAFGVVIGPFLGGILSRPQDRWPSVFSNPFWDTYPYLLPCLASAAFACASLVVVAKYLEETVDLRSPSADSDLSREEMGDALDLHAMDLEKPLPLRDILTRPVIVSVANYSTLALLGMASSTLTPLIWSTSIEFGGLDLSPASIGVWLSVYGCMDGVFQFVVFPRAVKRFDLRTIFAASIGVFAVVYTMYPLENLVLRRAADGPAWLFILVQLAALSISKMGYSAVLMYLSSAAPNKRSLGTTNGLATSVASVQRTIAPAVADWIFAFSIEKNVLGGNFVYLVLLALVGVALYVAAQLPKNMWKRDAGWIPLT